MTMQSMKSDLSRKAFILLTCGAILAGGGIQIGLISLATNQLFHTEAVETERLGSSTASLGEDNISRVDADKEFLAIESQLTSAFVDPAAPLTWVEEFKEVEQQSFLYGLYPLLPGYAEYVVALEAAELRSITNERYMHRMIQWKGFKNTCEMVSDLDSGLDINQKDKPDYSGEYSSLVGTKPENFVILLKACGDENLEYLDEMEEAHRASEKESDQMWAEIEKLNEEVEKLQEEGTGPSPQEPAEAETEDV